MCKYLSNTHVAFKYKKFYLRHKGKKPCLSDHFNHRFGFAGIDNFNPLLSKHFQFSISWLPTLCDINHRSIGYAHHI